MLRTLAITVGIACLACAAATSANADAPIEGRGGRAEVRFLEGMIDHHQMALDMAGHALEHATAEPVKTLSQAIIDAQTAEIELMQGWLHNWYNIDYTPMPMSTDGMEMDEHAGHSGMDMPATDPTMTMGMFAGLNRLEGAEYDIAWLESMIDHHDDALHMSERVLTRNGTLHPELVTLASDIITAQTAEIAQMETLITELSNG